ncbi:synaptic vesicle glycoprotein 2C-like isoform X2 [Bombus bifarius]|uniref:Synaptic vesicle glycoprotein 2C-like isoform X2 n=1 Tax=Bombus bifarius TaxID=103933 RepID=A0A6P8N0W6_9HYME|nr:synaptic vesicle glycoprotein 2C-like isoform X2 [Bombus vancouverensis nearcticus]XP_033319766.1 synaptic vesicle glycoprotein 2C-like isoform X2 [Bombus bifarius]
MMVFKRFFDLLSVFSYKYLRCEDVKSEESGPVDFERAITNAGYGKFNYLLLLAVLPASFSSIFSSSAMSYVLPSAECDLRLTMFDKGLLNSMTFAGMISTSFFWGFMTDTFGRKKIMFYGYMVAGIMSLTACFSHTSWLLILFKFLDGVIMSGPYAALMSYLAEVHNDAQRSRTYMWLGVFFSLGNISLPCIAWLIIPQKWTINIWTGVVKISSWRVFLAICSLPEFLACLAIFAFPESPRFLLLKGRREEALEVFRKIYSVNTGKDPDTYPIKDIDDEYSVELASNSKIKDKLRSCWQQIKPLFLSPNIFKLIAIGMIQLGATIGSNSIRLWMPQLFTMMEQFKNDDSKYEYSSSQPRFCYMLGQQGANHNFSTSFVNETLNAVHTCVPMDLNSKVFINSIVIAVTGVIGYTLAGTLITVVGKKKLIATCFIVAAACCGSLYWAEDTNSILGLCSVFVAMSSIGGACVVNVIVDNFLFFRTMAVSLTMMVGRIGAVIGNLLFPVLFDLSCLGPFIMIGSASLVSALLVTILPRKKSQKNKPKQIA